MNKLILIAAVLAIGLAAYYMYNENRPSEMESAADEAGRSLERAGDRVDGFINEAAENIDRGINKVLD